MSESPRGLVYGVAAYLCWGLAPLYWPLLAPAGALEALAMRIVWSMLFVAVLLSVTRRWKAFRTIWRNPVQIGWLTLASLVIAVNWFGFIYGVTHGRVIEVSLGYFINPLVTVLLGVVLLKESMRPAQWAAVGIGGAAVVLLTVDYGRLPVIALTVAGSFAIYGFVKKRARLGAVEALGAETLILTPVAFGYLGWLESTGDLVFGHAGTLNAALLAGTGVVTAIPLLFFAGAATRLPLSALGLLQYLGPVLHFVLGLVVFLEPMSGVRWIGFVLVWSALMIFTADALRSARPLRRARCSPVTTPTPPTTASATDTADP